MSRGSPGSEASWIEPRRTCRRNRQALDNLGRLQVAAHLAEVGSMRPSVMKRGSMRLRALTLKTMLAGFVVTTLAASFPKIAAADHDHHRKRHRKQRCEYVVRVDPAVYRRRVYFAPPPPPAHVCGYYYDRACERRFTSYQVYLEHARRHQHTRLVFVVTDGDEWRGSGVSGWVRVNF